MAAASNTVRDTMVSFRKSVDTFINTEMQRQQGVRTDLEAARNVSLAIENAMVLYSWPGTLDLPTHKAPDDAAKQLVELSKLVTDLTSKKTDILTLYQRAQSFIVALQFHSWEPRLAGTLHPHVYVKGNCFEVSFKGLFENAVAYNAARLVVGQDKLTPTQATKERLNFSVKLRKNYLPEKALNQCCLIKASLEVGYNHGSWMSYPKTAQYEVYIGLYPLLAAQATVISSIKERIEDKKQTTRSPTFMFSGENQTSNSISYHATPGWTISGVPKLVIDEISDEISSDKYSGTRVDLQLSVTADRKETKAYVEFEESQPAFVSTESTHTVSLKWDEPFNFEAETFKINIKPLEGAEVELTETKQEEGYFKVVGSDGQYQLIAVPPEQKS